MRYYFPPHDSDSLVLSDIRELLYILVRDAAKKNYFAEEQRREFAERRMGDRNKGDTA